MKNEKDKYEKENKKYQDIKEENLKLIKILDNLKMDNELLLKENNKMKNELLRLEPVKVIATISLIN